jgi:hypothetical protein
MNDVVRPFRDSPIGLCAWLVEKIWTWADHDGDLNAVIARRRLLDNVTLYWESIAEVEPLVHCRGH